MLETRSFFYIELNSSRNSIVWTSSVYNTFLDLYWLPNTKTCPTHLTSTHQEKLL
ncbi:hypothetical protein PGB90_008264 [Kerria lacca]